MVGARQLVCAFGWVAAVAHRKMGQPIPPYRRTNWRAPTKTDQNHRSVATPGQCCTFCTGRHTDFGVTPLRLTIAVQDHLSESRLRSM